MGVELVIRDQKFYSEFNNGVDFLSNPSKFTNNITGSVMDNVRLSRLIDVSWNSKASETSGEWNIQYLGSLEYRFKKNDGSSFSKDGFAVGDTIDWSWDGGGGVIITEGLISSLTPTYIYITMVAAPFTPLVEEKTGTSIFYGKTPLTALNYGFGLQDNADTSVDVESKVSGNDQGYYGANIGFNIGGGVRDTNFVDLIKLGSYAGWETGEMKIRYVNNPSTYVQRFEVQHDLTLVPFFLDGEINDLRNKIISTLFSGTNSIKYTSDFEFRTLLSNPNTKKVFSDTTNLGSVAWFEENFNGFKNNYAIKSVDYKEQLTSNNADGILVSSATRITVLVENLTGSYTGGERFGAYISYLPSQSEYQNTTTKLKENFIYDNVINNEGLPSSSGKSFISGCTASVVGGDLEIVIDMEYTSDQKNRLANIISNREANYLLAIQVGDENLLAGNSDVVTLIADVNTYDQSADIPNLMTVTKYRFYPPDQQKSGDSYSNLTLWNEDGFLLDFSFSLNLAKKAVMNDLCFSLVAFNTVTEEYFELDSYNYNIFPAVISNGVQQLNFNGTRGYDLEVGDQFNEVTISNSGVVAGSEALYSGTFAQKISWQDWISNSNADTTFFNISQPNDGLNNKSSNYSLKEDYEIHLVLKSNISGVSDFGVAGDTDYLAIGGVLTVNDYDEDVNNEPNIWTCTIETFDAINMTPLGGAVLNGRNTLIRATHSNVNGAVTDLLTLWAFQRIETTDQGGYDNEEINTLTNSPSNNLLIPSSGSNLNMYLSGGNVITESLVNGVNASGQYNITARVGDNTDISINGKTTSPDGVLKQTSGVVTVKTPSP